MKNADGLSIQGSLPARDIDQWLLRCGLLEVPFPCLAKDWAQRFQRLVERFVLLGGKRGGRADQEWWNPGREVFHRWYCPLVAKSERPGKQIKPVILHFA